MNLIDPQTGVFIFICLALLGVKRSMTSLLSNDKAKEIGKAAADKAIRKWLS